MLGFFSICGIEEGLDLQFDLESRDKAAVLLGILSDAFDRLPVSPKTEQFEQWKKIGVRIMKMRSSKPPLS